MVRAERVGSRRKGVNDDNLHTLRKHHGLNYRDVTPSAVFRHVGTGDATPEGMKIVSTLFVISAFTVGGVGAWKLQPLRGKPAVSPAVAAHGPEEIAPPVIADGDPGIANVRMPAALGSAKNETPARGSVAEVAPVPAEAIEKPVLEYETVELITAAQQGVVEATITGNAREIANVLLRSNSPAPWRVLIPAGQVLESGRNSVVVLRDAKVELAPGQRTEVRLHTAALHSSNKVVESQFKLSYQAVTKVQLFLTWLADHPEVSAPAAQTAVLALTENLPVNALSKFAPANGISGKFDTDAFRVETSDIVSALRALRDSGVGMQNIALTLDPQLRIEAMIEPLSREAAKRYYGIADEAEWEFWKHELLQGDASTRHYALFGIARFYPDIALEMLPKWAREPKTHPVYRLSAVQAIADTQRPEALPLLHRLGVELGPESELGKAAAQAAAHLDQRLAQLSQNSPIVAFRGKHRVGGL